jgi:hypothetical protein
MKNKIKITEPQLKMLQESFNDYNETTESDKLLDYSHNEMSPEQIGQIFILAANVGVIRDSVQKYFTEFVQMWHTREEAQKHIELLKQMVDKEESGGEGDSMDSEFYNRNQGGENLNEQVSRIKNMMGTIVEQPTNKTGTPVQIGMKYFLDHLHDRENGSWYNVSTHPLAKKASVYNEPKMLGPAAGNGVFAIANGKPMFFQMENDKTHYFYIKYGSDNLPRAYFNRQSGEIAESLAGMASVQNVLGSLKQIAKGY